MSEGPIQVLVMDDDTEVVQMISMGLGADGMQVHCVGDGEEGIELLSKTDIDVIILDIMMPKVDGWMALMDIRTHPKTAQTPVIMLSAKTQERAKILAFKQGVQQYVTKPFSVLELAARVESLAQQHRRASDAVADPGEAGFRKLPVRKGGRTVLLAIDDVVYFSTRNKSTYAHTYENQYLVDQTLTEIQSRLARESFVRVHRSFIVSLDKITEILRVDGSYVVVARDRDETHIPVARRQLTQFREAVGI